MVILLCYSVSARDSAADSSVQIKWHLKKGKLMGNDQIFEMRFVIEHDSNVWSEWNALLLSYTQAHLIRKCQDYVYIK